MVTHGAKTKAKRDYTPAEASRRRDDALTAYAIPPSTRTTDPVVKLERGEAR